MWNPAWTIFLKKWATPTLYLRPLTQTSSNLVLSIKTLASSLNPLISQKLSSLTRRFHSRPVLDRTINIWAWSTHFKTKPILLKNKGVTQTTTVIIIVITWVVWAKDKVLRLSQKAGILLTSALVLKYNQKVMKIQIFQRRKPTQAITTEHPFNPRILKILAPHWDKNIRRIFHGKVLIICRSRIIRMILRQATTSSTSNTQTSNTPTQLFYTIMKDRSFLIWKMN